MIDEEIKEYLDLFISKYKAKKRGKDSIKEALKKYLYKNRKKIFGTSQNLTIDFRVWKYRQWLKYVYAMLGVRMDSIEKLHKKYCDNCLWFHNGTCYGIRYHIPKIAEQPICDEVRKEYEKIIGEEKVYD